jgi:hypothetical protein
MLDHHDRVGPRRHRRSCHDLDRFPSPEISMRPGLPRTQLPHNLQITRRQVIRTTGKTIPRGAGKRRLIAIGGNRLG